MISTRPSRISRSLGIVALLGFMTVHAAVISWACSVAAHLVVASAMLLRPSVDAESVRLAGGKVSRAVELMITMPPAHEPPQVVEVILEEPAPPTEASSSHPAPDSSMPQLESLALVRSSEASRVAPRRSVERGPRERFAHAVPSSDVIPRLEPSPVPTEANEVTPPQLPRRESAVRPSVPLAAASLPSTLGTEVDETARPIHNPPPIYPAAALASRTEGRVMLRLVIDAAGKVETASIEGSSGSSLLDQAALEAIRRWRFEPARRGGKAVEWSCLLPIRFRLD